ncbi:MAG: hypothetical protein NTW06_02865 [Candidatus Falkowbacteria bacterium]|nr:hypothetical protein [Candidatus Falkowbacteria bacterium]
MKKKQTQNGYSLLEIVVATSLFAFVMLMTLSIFQSVNEGQKSAIASQNIQENLRFALEVISKEIRQAVISNNDCPGGSGTGNRIYNKALIAVPGGGVIAYNTFYFKKIKNNQKICVYYYLDNKRLRIARQRQPVDEINFPTINDYITPAEIKITNFLFNIVDNTASTLPEDKIQPRVNLRIKAEMATSSPMHKQPILIQTTISARSYGDTDY